MMGHVATGDDHPLHIITAYLRGVFQKYAEKSHNFTSAA